jgi:hypothetical protein
MGAASRRRTVSQFEWRLVIAQYEDLWADRAAVRQPRDWKPSRWHLPYFDTFQSYASSTITDAAALRITEEGRRALSGEAPWPAYRLGDSLLDQRVVRDLLALAATDQPLSLGDLSAQLAERTGSPRTRRHAMWAAKYGLIDLVEPR